MILFDEKSLKRFIFLNIFLFLIIILNLIHINFYIQKNNNIFQIPKEFNYYVMSFNKNRGLKTYYVKNIKILDANDNSVFIKDYNYAWQNSQDGYDGVWVKIDGEQILIYNKKGNLVYSSWR